MMHTPTAARPALAPVRKLLVLTCAACPTWLGLAPSATAAPIDREERRRDVRLIEHGDSLLPLQPSLPAPSLADALAGAMRESRATTRSCEAPCARCAGSLIAVGASSAAIGLSCGGAVFSGGLSLGACWLSLASSPGVVLVAASNCSGCDHCLNAPDPETPPGGGRDDDDCEPCDPNDPLTDCLDPEPGTDPCEGGAGNP